MDGPMLMREKDYSSRRFPLVLVSRFWTYGRSITVPCGFCLLDSSGALLVYHLGDDPQYAAIPSRTEHDGDYNLRG